MRRVLDPADLEVAIGDLDDDPVIVNHRITGAYHRLSEQMRAALDTDVDLDWCGFAKWSSHTVGLEINPQTAGTVGRTGAAVDALTAVLVDDELAARIPALQAGTRRLVLALLTALAAAEDGLARRALRAGNITIFAEMGTAYVSLLDRLRGGPEAAGTDEEFAARVADGIVRTPEAELPAPLTRDHLVAVEPSPLVRGLLFYLRAAREPQRRSELILAGNVMFSLFEQARADRLIAIGLCTPSRARLIPVFDALPGLPDIDPRAGLLAGSRHPNPIIRAIDELVVGVLTDESLFVEYGIGEPRLRVRLGHPEQLPPPPFRPTLPDVVAVLAEQVDHAAGVPHNWLDLRYRMNVITGYFAALQQKPETRLAPPGGA